MAEFVLVPREPTEAMMDALARQAQKPTGWHDVYPAMYRALLAAAPQPPEDAVERVIAVSREWGEGEPLSEPFARAIVAACASPREKALEEALRNMMGLFDNPIYRRKLADEDGLYAESIRIARALLDKEGK